MLHVLEGRGRSLALAWGNLFPGKEGATSQLPLRLSREGCPTSGRWAGGPPCLPFFHRYFPRAWPVSGTVPGVGDRVLIRQEDT